MSPIIVENAVTKNECADIKESPDEFQIFSVLIGLFAFIWFDLFPQFKMILYSKMRAEFINIHTNENEDKNG